MMQCDKNSQHRIEEGLSHLVAIGRVQEGSGGRDPPFTSNTEEVLFGWQEFPFLMSLDSQWRSSSWDERVL